MVCVPAQEQMMITRLLVLVLGCVFNIAFFWLMTCLLGRLGFTFFVSLVVRTMELSCRLSRGTESDPTIILRPAHPTSRPHCILAHIRNDALPFEYVD